MKTFQNITRWLGLVLACGIITFAASAQAGKPVKPPKPPPEPPPPSGPAYWIIPVDGAIYPYSLGDSGTLVGSVTYKVAGSSFSTPAALPPRILNGEPQYLADDLQCLPDLDGLQNYGECVAMNEAGVAVGYIDFGLRAILWLADGTPVDLGVAPAGLPSTADDINDAGLVLVGIGNWNQEGEGGGVVVPLDLDADGAPDTWFMDNNADGINDLFFRTDSGHYLLPLFINEAGQVLSAQIADGDPVAGYLLTPDFSDADGDGNPWYADVNPADGVNDLLVALEPLVPGTSVSVAGLNNLGQVVGTSGGHAVRWEFVDSEQIVTDLGALSDKSVMTVTGISDSGRIVGTSKIPTGRGNFGKDGPSWLIENENLYEFLPLVVNSGGWSELSADGINRDGWIHGLGILDGSRRRFVAIPVVEP